MEELLQSCYFPPLRAIPAAILLLMAARAVGTCFLRLCPGNTKQQWSCLISLAAGIDLLSLLFLGLGKLFFALPVACLWGGLLLLAGMRLFLFLRRKKEALPWSAADKIAAAILTLYAAGALVNALLPPSGWDELVYQTALPLRWIRSGAFAVFPDNPYSGFPSLMQIFESAGIRMGGIAFPRVWVTALYLVMGWRCWKFFSQRCAVFAGGMIAAGLFFSPLYYFVGFENNVEILILLHFLALAELLGEGDAKNLVPAGLIAGGMAACKLTAGGPLLAAAGIWWVMSRAGRRVPWNYLGLGAGCAILLGGFFYLRTGLATGNPFWPYFEAFFSNQPAALATSQFHQEMGSYRYGLEGAGSLVYLWIFAIIQPKLFDGIGLGWAFAGGMLCVLGALLHRPWRQKMSRNFWAWTAAFAALYLFWWATAQQTRFAMPLMFACFAAAAEALALLVPERKRRMATLFLFLLPALFSFPWKELQLYGNLFHLARGSHQLNAAGIALSGSGPGGEEAVMEYLAKTPKKSFVMFLFDPRTLYSPRRCVAGR
ncbi:MAG: hypothetical protein PHS41_05070, partial [Victivallaceae bacterium]|nr:hypothetical protein [Victivallaceae bacterium]